MMNEVERAFELYGKRLYAYMRRLGLSEVEAEDGVQEVFIRAMRSSIDGPRPKVICSRSPTTGPWTYLEAECPCLTRKKGMNFRLERITLKMCIYFCRA